MSLVLPVVEVYRLILTPVPLFTWFGLPLRTIDLLTAFRLCLALRQRRERFLREHILKSKTVNATEKDITSVQDIEERSFVRDAAAVLTVVFAGEALMAPSLAIPPSFMLSGVVPILYMTVMATVNKLPWVPVPSFELELPLAIMDGFSRAFRLCTLVPPMVLKHTSPTIQTNPWSLLLTALVTPNAGFLFTNMFSLFHPYALELTTPMEFLPYGWTTTDLWCAPLITALYALLTHAQPFWADAHAVAVGWLGATSGSGGEEKVEAVDTETARAVCAVILAGFFVTRVVRNFGPARKAGPKTKVQ